MDEDNSLLLLKRDDPSPISQKGMDRIGAHESSPHRGASEWANSSLGTDRRYLPDVGKYLRVVTEADGDTVHNAFFDRRFRP
jgi:hypothetical protein